jgi:2-polyprenyl-6-methoxyphenol hydroxylase-like FAD-dependent oxidoreductase
MHRISVSKDPMGNEQLRFLQCFTGGAWQGADSGQTFPRPGDREIDRPATQLCVWPDAAWRLMLCGDAAHIVPPTGARGLNLAASDVFNAADALTAFFKRADDDAIVAYSGKALARVWKAERFSWSRTRLLHRFPEDGPFERVMQVAELDYIASSRAAQTSIAENYVGLSV